MTGQLTLSHLLKIPKAEIITNKGNLTKMESGGQERKFSPVYHSMTMQIPTRRDRFCTLAGNDTTITRRMIFYLSSLEIDHPMRDYHNSANEMPL